MSNSHLPLVNQKFANASALLKIASGVQDACGASRAIERRATLESAVLQMHLAYIFYLRELAENYGLKGYRQLGDVNALVVALESAGRSAGEAAELQHLQAKNGGWLEGLMSAQAALVASPAAPAPRKSFEEQASIDLIDVTHVPDLVVVDLVSVNEWLAEFRALVLRQRETSLEY